MDYKPGKSRRSNGVVPDFMKGDVGKGYENIRDVDLLWIDENPALSEGERMDPDKTLHEFFELPVLEILVAAIIDGHPSRDDERTKRIKTALKALTGERTDKGKNEIEEAELIERLVLRRNARKLEEAYADKSSIETIIKEILLTTPPYDGGDYDVDQFERALARVTLKCRNQNSVAARAHVREDYDFQKSIGQLLAMLSGLGVKLARKF